MYFVTVRPEMLAAAAGNLLGLASVTSAANASGKSDDRALPAADEVSALTATQLGAPAAMDQAVSAQAGGFRN
jgi:hypothetical protein